MDVKYQGNNCQIVLERTGFKTRWERNDAIQEDTAQK